MTVSNEPTLQEVVLSAVRAGSRDVRVALPGRVEKYDVDKQAADIKPLIQEVTVQGEEPVSLSVIAAVPVTWMGGGGFFLSFPLKRGDQGILLVCDRSIDKWVGGDGQEVDPVWRHTHDLTDAVFIPGARAYKRAIKDAHADNVVVGKDGGIQIHIKDGEIHLGSENAADAVALASVVDNQLATIKADLDALHGVVSANAGVYNTFAAHASGSSVFAIPAPTQPIDPVGSEVIKSD